MVNSRTCSFKTEVSEHLILFPKKILLKLLRVSFRCFFVNSQNQKCLLFVSAFSYSKDVTLAASWVANRINEKIRRFKNLSVENASQDLKKCSMSAKEKVFYQKCNIWNIKGSEYLITNHLSAEQLRDENMTFMWEEFFFFKAFEK